MKIFALLAVVLATLMSPAFAAETPGQTTAEMFAEQFPLTSKVLSVDFPRDLLALEQGFADIDSSEILPQMKMQRVFLNLTALRKKYAPLLQYVRGDRSEVVVLSLADFYHSVWSRNGHKVCGSFAVDGAGTLYAVGVAADYAPELDRQAAAFFTAVVSALIDPDVVGPATEDDWTQVMTQIVADGHPPSYIASIAAGRVGDPDLCPALSAFLTAMVAVKSDAAQRTRADFIQNTTGY